MCGITGIINFDRAPVNRDVVERMCTSLRHRGPDGHGIEQPFPWIGLGHQRLSILDLEKGRQPLSNEDGTIWITYNGEIFNYPELRRELMAKGHRFATQTDTEVIVHLFEEEGPACVKRLNGQFAFALWDGKQLVCARDPMGIKPFYWYQDDNRLAFASEPRALFALPGWQPEIDLEGIHLYFMYRFIPAPKSAWKRVHKLRAGEMIIVDSDGHLTHKRYWKLNRDRVETLDNPEKARMQLREILHFAVKRQLLSDVPVGAFLSGGLDSSSIVALMAESHEENIQSFSMGFHDPRYDERKYAREVSNQIGTCHNVDVFGPQEARQVLGEILDHMDEPFGDSAILPTFALARLARSKVKVVLSGDGGDELFAGYGRYFRALHLLAIPPILRPFWQIIRHLQKPPQDPVRWRYSDTQNIEHLYHRFLQRISNRGLKQLYGPLLRSYPGKKIDDPLEDLVASVRDLPPLSRVLAIDLHSILSEYHLVKVDRASMQNSLEVRVPFLDTAFVDFAFQLTASLKLYGKRDKGLLREAMGNVLPSSVIDRGKRGFGPPLKYWFVDALADLAHERLQRSMVVSEGFLNQRAVDALLQPVRGKIEGVKIWRVMVLESWLHKMKENAFA